MGFSNTTAKELLDKEVSLKFVMVDEKQSQLVLSNHKSMVGFICRLELDLLS